MDYLKELCQDLEIDPTLEKTEKGFFILPLTPALKIKIMPLDPGASFTSPISPCPKMKREELFIHLMKGNLFAQGTLGSKIGLDESENLLTLSLDLPYDMNYRAFREALEDFANIVDYWRDEINQHIERAQSGIV